MDDQRPEAERRGWWVELAVRIAEPVLTAAAERRLVAELPVLASRTPSPGGAAVAAMEAVCRTLAGLGPWLALGETGELEASEAAACRRLAESARAAIASGVDPASPNTWRGGVKAGGAGEAGGAGGSDGSDGSDGSGNPGAAAAKPEKQPENQTLVEAAFLAQALLRAPAALWEPLAPSVKQQVLEAMRESRQVTPFFNNWLLFSATVEAFLASVGEDYDAMRVDYALRQHEQWYLGDGLYRDGPHHANDYYNSLVIHPMLLDIVGVLDRLGRPWVHAEAIDGRARRAAAVLERLIGPEGSYPPLGRSLTYRFGVFHLLAQAALESRLLEPLTPAQVRGGLSAVLHRSASAPGTFDDRGFLRPGIAGHQPGLAEPYISTGSLYLCCTALLPLGLAPGHSFWHDPSAPWTARQVWSGMDVERDRKQN